MKGLVRTRTNTRELVRSHEIVHVSARSRTNVRELARSRAKSQAKSPRDRATRGGAARFARRRRIDACQAPKPPRLGHPRIRIPRTRQPIARAEEGTRATHRHVSDAQAVEHRGVRVLELREVDVLLDVLVLGAQLRKAALVVHRVVVRGREEAVGRPRRGCIGASGR